MAQRRLPEHIREFEALVQQAGLTMEIERAKHLKLRVRNPETGASRLVTISGTSRAQRGLLNARSDMRQAIAQVRTPL